jgi:hypothetical protein
MNQSSASGKEMTMAEILPDCRTKDRRNFSQTQLGISVPIFCANCGAPGGDVPEENMTFAFYLCTRCAETYGQIAGMMMMPDQVFFEKVKQEQLEAYGRYLSELELLAVVEADASPLATLIKERQRA